MTPYNKKTDQPIKLTKEQEDAIAKVREILNANQIQLDLIPTENHMIDTVVAVFKSGDVAPVQDVEYAIHKDGFMLSY